MPASNAAITVSADPLMPRQIGLTANPLAPSGMRSVAFGKISRLAISIDDLFKAGAELPLDRAVFSVNPLDNRRRPYIRLPDGKLCSPHHFFLTGRPEYAKH
jgi:hypothetical protein